MLVALTETPATDLASVGNDGDLFLDVVGTYAVSAGGGAIPELGSGKIELRVGSTVREKLLLSVVKVPPAPYSPGSM